MSRVTVDALELPRRFALETAGQVVVYGVRFDTGHVSAQIVNAPSPVPHWGHLDDLTRGRAVEIRWIESNRPGAGPAVLRGVGLVV